MGAFTTDNFSIFTSSSTCCLFSIICHNYIYSSLVFKNLRKMVLPRCRGTQIKKHERLVRKIKKTVKPRNKNQSKKSAAIAIANSSLKCFVKRKS